MAFYELDAAAFRAAYPAFTEEAVSAEQLAASWEAVKVLLGDGEGNFPYPEAKMQPILWAALCHLLSLDGNGLDQPSRIASATEGSVSTSFENLQSKTEAGSWWNLTKCGALFGEAVVFPKPNTCPRFFTWMKQQGALLAKGRITGLQFETLMEENLYVEYGAKAVRLAEKLREGLKEKGYQLLFNSTTNQTFVKLPDDKYQTLSEKVGMSFWEKPDDNHTIVRLATSWATTEEDVDALLALM